MQRDKSVIDSANDVLARGQPVDVGQLFLDGRTNGLHRSRELSLQGHEAIVDGPDDVFADLYPVRRLELRHDLTGQFFHGIHHGGNGPGDTVLQALHDELADLGHLLGWRVNLERITDAVPERLENVIYNPCTNAKDSVLDAEEEARNSVASSFLRFLFEVVARIRQRTGQNLNDCINGFTDKAAQRLRQLVPAHTRHSPDKHFNEVLCHLIEVDAIHQVGQRVDSLRESVEETLDCTLHVAVTQRVGQLGGDDLANPIPVFALQPLLQLVIEAREAAGERLKHSRPVQLFQETTGQIQRHGKLLRQQPPEDVPVNLIDDAVDRLGQMLADIHPVHRVHGVVQRLDGGIHALADFCSPAGPINAVHQLIDFVAQQCAQLFPVSFLKCLFQLVRKVQHGAVNGDLLKHLGGVNGTIVFRVVRVLIVQNVQFIEAGQSRLCLFCRLRRFVEALGVVLLNGRCLSVGF